MRGMMCEVQLVLLFALLCYVVMCAQPMYYGTIFCSHCFVTRHFSFSFQGVISLSLGALHQGTIMRSSSCAYAVAAVVMPVPCRAVLRYAAMRYALRRCSSRCSMLLRGDAR